jgi:NAD/NADP transhydrogenase beta subunit
LDGVHLASIYLATVIGSVTFTGSLVAFGKLDGRLSSAPLKLTYRDQINMGLGAVSESIVIPFLSFSFANVKSHLYVFLIQKWYTPPVADLRLHLGPVQL